MPKLTDQNRLSIVAPELCKEWNYKKNSLKPEDVSSGSEKKIWWKCKKGHEWEAVVYSRVSGNGCPYCAGKKANKENCLETTHPKIASEWDYDRNKILTPSKITKGNTKSVWWKCKNGHSWKTNANVRTSQGTGCPYCCGNLFRTELSLLAVNPELAKEWHPKKNGKLLPNQVGFKSKLKIWWKCKSGHEWKTKVSHRNDGSNCPFCNKIELKDGTVWDSKIEALVYLFLKYKKIYFLSHEKYEGSFGRRKYDFYLPEYNMYVEVTSYNENTCHRWARYLRGIAIKKEYVEKKIGKKFIFIQHNISKDENRFLSEKLKRK